MAQCIKQPLVMLAFHIRELVWVSAVLLMMSLATNVPEKAEEEDPGAWASVTHVEFLAPGFSLT